ncbi:MAG: VTT domain-containing protein [Longilinea sp.]|nr:VTT domain-containing protein [Longilinea sp.]
MSASDLSSLVLDWIASYGAWMVAGLLFLGGLGLPLPGTLIVIASGAFIRQSLLAAISTPLLAYLGTVAGDVLLYRAGWTAGAWLERKLSSRPAWAKAVVLFERRGGGAVFWSRWLLTAVALPVTLIAGSSRYSFKKFIFFDALGELTWVLLYGGLGYGFGSQWELISEFVSNFSGFVLGAMVLLGGVYLLLKFRKPR